MVGVVIETGLRTAVVLPALLFLGLALVLGFDFFALALLLAFIVRSLGPLVGLMIANV